IRYRSQNIARTREKAEAGAILASIQLQVDFLVVRSLHDERGSVGVAIFAQNLPDFGITFLHGETFLLLLIFLGTRSCKLDPYLVGPEENALLPVGVDHVEVTILIGQGKTAETFLRHEIDDQVGYWFPTS